MLGKLMFVVSVVFLSVGTSYAWEGMGNNVSLMQASNNSSMSASTGSGSQLLYSMPNSSFSLRTGTTRVIDGYSYDLNKGGVSVGSYTLKYARNLETGMLSLRLNFRPSGEQNGVTSQFNTMPFSNGVLIAVGKDVDYLAPSADGQAKLAQAHTLAENLIKLDMSLMNDDKPSKFGSSAFSAFCSAAGGKEEYIVISSSNKNSILGALSVQGIFPKGTKGNQVEVAVNSQTINSLTELALDDSGAGSGISYIDSARKISPVAQ